jgi:HK97 gp10 family phage protein
MSIELSVQVEGLDKLAKSSELIQQRAKNEIEKALYASAKKVESDAKRSILDGNKTGRVYKRGNVTHRASAPGEAPASDTGRLVNSFVTGLNRVAGGLSSFIIAGGGTVKYARILEFGTTKMAPRPFMFPALEKNKDWIRNRLRDGMQKALSGK